MERKYSVFSVLLVLVVFISACDPVTWGIIGGSAAATGGLVFGVNWAKCCCECCSSEDWDSDGTCRAEDRECLNPDTCDTCPDGQICRKKTDLVYKCEPTDIPYEICGDTANIDEDCRGGSTGGLDRYGNENLCDDDGDGHFDASFECNSPGLCNDMDDNDDTICPSQSECPEQCDAIDHNQNGDFNDNILPITCAYNTTHLNGHKDCIAPFRNQNTGDFWSDCKP